MEINQEQRRTNRFIVCFSEEPCFLPICKGRPRVARLCRERRGGARCLLRGCWPGEAGGSWLEGGIPGSCFREHIWLSLVGPELERICGDKSREVGGHCPSPNLSGPLMQRMCLPSRLVTWVGVPLAWPESSAHSVSYFVLRNISSKVWTEYTSVGNFKLRKVMGYFFKFTF